MLNILTRPPKIWFPGSARYFSKWLIKKILNKKRGPDGVLESLKRGLNELRFPFVINAPLQKGQIVHVISNMEALKYAVAHKESVGISKLVAGPNLVVLPDERDSLLASTLIDIVLTVSPWVTDLYGKIIPSLIPKMHIWPAGVQMPDANAYMSDSPSNIDQNFICIVFKKKVPVNIYEKAIHALDEKKIKYKVFVYGTFKQKEYFDALSSISGRNGFMIYLQESESQGIAFQEAWIRNVPTLVWNKGSYTSTTGINVTGNVGAPFLTDEAGMLFSGISDLDAALDAFILKKDAADPSNAFHPREYCLQSLTDKASAQTYLRATGL